MELNRREFIKLLGIAVVACNVPLPSNTGRRADDSDLKLIQQSVEAHVRHKHDNKDIYDFVIVCDDRNNHPDFNHVQIDFYVKSVRATSLIHTNIKVDYGFKIDENYLNRGRYELLDLVGPRALAVLETFYA